MAESPETLESLTLGGVSDTEAAKIVAVTEKLPAGFVNASMSLSFGEYGNYEVSVWGRNIFDKRVFIHDLYVGGANDYVSGIRNEPATYGITTTAKF